MKLKFQQRTYRISLVSAIRFLKKDFDMKQPSRGVLGKRFSENMQQIYRRTPMPKCDFNTVAATLLKSHFGMGVLLQICCISSEHLSLIHLCMAASGYGKLDAYQGPQTLLFVSQVNQRAKQLVYPSGAED